jgi:leader peptidase (prepilin peptidase) / N-methyltransferase
MSLEVATLAFVGLLGLLVGSFLNVVIYRTPRVCLSVWKQTRSRCPQCGVQLRWFDNIPVASWVALKGRCHGCRTPISMRYPAVELLTGALFLGLYWFDVARLLPSYLLFTSEAAGPWALFGVHAFVAATLLALSVIDIDFRILPDAITLPGIVLTPLLAWLAPEVMPEPLALLEGVRANALANGMAGALGAGIGLYALGWGASKLFRKDAMGLGDVKLFAGMGGLLGVWVLFALLVACFLGSVVGIAVLLIKRDRYVPFGPFLALGTMVTSLWGPRLLDEIAMFAAR